MAQCSEAIEAGSAIELDDSQRRVTELGTGHGPVLVLGGPGTGKTTVVVEYVLSRLRAGTDPDEILVLTNTRVGADALRGQLTGRLNEADFTTRSTSPVRSFASYAFDVIHRVRAEGLLPHVEEQPRLLAGAEQDQLIAELLDGYVDAADESEAALLAKAAGAPEIAWPESLQEAVGLRGFRQEVRDLIDRCAEYGITPGQLEELGAQYARPEWSVAASIVQDYRDLLNLGRSEAFDAAGLITTAADLLEAHPDFLAAEKEQLPVIVVDDFQDATPAIHRLVRILASDHDVVLTANPDTTVQGFRGAAPQQLAGWPDVLVSADPRATGEASGENRVLVLEHGYRMAPGILEAWQRVARRIPAVPGLPDTRNVLDALSAGEESAAGGEVGQDAQVHWLASATQEQQFVLQQILARNYEHDVPFAEMAVIARTSSTVASMANFLEANGIAVQRSIAEMVLNKQPTVKPLLAMVRAASATLETQGEAGENSEQPGSLSGLEPAEISWLLSGPYGATDAVAQRMLRRRVLNMERQRGGERNSSELMDALIADPAEFYALLGMDAGRSLPRYAQGALRIAQMLAAMRQENDQADSTAETVLWAGWETVQNSIGEEWKKAALGEDTDEARRGHANLDAVVALFDAAERYVEQFAGQSAAGFTDYLESQDLPLDSLSRRSAAQGAVSVMTPSTATGRQWDTVFVVGVQDGVWPNTKLRGQLLHTQQLVDLVTGREGPANYADRVAAVRHDEMRTFSAAISRASRRLVATAVVSEEQQPSQFLDRVQPWEGTREQPVRPLTTLVKAPLTTHATVAQLRQELESAAREGADEDAGQRVADMAGALAVMAGAGVSVAEPENWWGLKPLSTQAAVQGPGIDFHAGEAADAADAEDAYRVPLSPSRTEAALADPLNWFVQRINGQPVFSDAMDIGNFVHGIAEDYPQASADELMEVFEQRFDGFVKGLGYELGSWPAQELYERCHSMIDFLGDYFRKSDLERRELVAVERDVQQDFEFEDLTVRVRGRIDRLEKTAEGRPIVVDYKTGKSTPPEKDIATLPQLGVYQAAIAAGALNLDADGKGPLASEFAHPTESGGALLVQLGVALKKLKVQQQDGISEPESWAQDDIHAAAQATTGPEFVTVHHKKSRCAVEALCPLCVQGRQVTEWLR